MAKLNKRDHLGLKVCGKIIQGVFGLALAFGAYVVGDKVLNKESNDQDQDKNKKDSNKA